MGVGVGSGMGAFVSRAGCGMAALGVVAGAAVGVAFRVTGAMTIDLGIEGFDPGITEMGGQAATGVE
jgi:hypothetical protein